MLILEGSLGARIVLPDAPDAIRALRRSRSPLARRVRRRRRISSTRRTCRTRANAGLDWRDQVIYQIMVDRFANGDPNNDFNVAPSMPGRYHGGDWQGDDRSPRLPRRRSASPRCGSRRSSRTSRRMPASRATTATGRRTSCDPTLTSATSTKLRELVDTAHEKGMLVILDVVTNHMGQLFYYDINGNGQPDDTHLRRRLLAHVPADLRAEPERSAPPTS